jgi:hypothetical protein
VVYISEILKIFHAEVVPFHQEYTGHEAVRDQYTYAREVLFTELPP